MTELNQFFRFCLFAPILLFCLVFLKARLEFLCDIVYVWVDNLELVFLEELLD